jgi:acyl-CoA reductase-like NAD-dependent aldehyde dehydrogenase
MPAGRPNFPGCEPSGALLEARARYLRRLHEAVSARIDDLTAAMVEEYGGGVSFAGPIVQSGVNALLEAEKGDSRSCRGHEAGERRRSPWSLSALPV